MSKMEASEAKMSHDATQKCPKRPSSMHIYFKTAPEDVVNLFSQAE